MLTKISACEALFLFKTALLKSFFSIGPFPIEHTSKSKILIQSCWKIKRAVRSTFDFRSKSLISYETSFGYTISAVPKMAEKMGK